MILPRSDDENGNVIWVQRYDGYGHSTDNATALILDANNFLYVIGSSIGETSDFDYTTVKYTTNGDVSWVRQFNGIPRIHPIMQLHLQLT